MPIIGSISVLFQLVTNLGLSDQSLVIFITYVTRTFPSFGSVIYVFLAGYILSFFSSNTTRSSVNGSVM